MRCADVHALLTRSTHSLVPVCVPIMGVIVTAATIGLCVAVIWLIWQLVTARQRRLTDRVPTVLAEMHKGKSPDDVVREENVAARLRISATRLAAAVEALPAENEKQFDAVIIGAGCSGLACAASLARCGYRCCVLEQNEEIGGGSHVFVESGGCVCPAGGSIMHVPCMTTASKYHVHPSELHIHVQSVPCWSLLGHRKLVLMSLVGVNEQCCSTDQVAWQYTRASLTASVCLRAGPLGF